MQQRGFRGPVALVLALLPGLLAGCGPSVVANPDEPALREDARALSASGPYMVRDINSLGVGSRPDGVAVVNGTLFFIRSSGPDAGLWKSDGTESGTVLVRNANGFELPGFLTVMGGTLFFYDGIGHALWKSDGTEAGTVRVTQGNLPQVVATAVVNDRLFLLTGTSLWVSDGTAAGTVPLASGAFTSARGLVAMNGTLFFSATTSEGVQLWKSDGTASGTVPLKFISTSAITTLELVPMNGTLFFMAKASSSALWKSDGTQEGTIPLQEGLDSFASLAAANGRLFFSNSGDLWTSDGTQAGTVLIASPGASISSFMATPGGVVFSVWQSGGGTMLWKSDGTASGTALVVDPCPGTSFGTPYKLASTRSTTFFSISCNPGDSGFALWKSDGTAAGTVLVKDGFQQTTEPGFYNRGTAAADVNGTLFFWADDGVHGSEPWKSDGTAAGTVLVRDIVAARAGSDPLDLVAVGNTLFFTANDGSNGRKLWKSDGTDSGTVPLKVSSSSNLTAVNGMLFFILDRELWRSDGTDAGTVQLHKFPLGSATGFPTVLSTLVDFDGTLFLTAWDDTHAELWKSDGTAAGTVRVKELFTGFSGDISHPVVMNGALFFIVGDGSSRLDLWKSDGTDTGTVRVKTLFQKDSSANAGSVQSMVALNGKLFFLLQPRASTTLPLQLWRSDGTEAGTQLFPELFSRAESPEALAQAGGTLFMLSGRGYKLWKSDGTVEGTSLIRQLLPISATSAPALKTTANVRGRLYLTIYAPTRDRWELWRSDGTMEGTGLVQPLALDAQDEFSGKALATFAEAGKRVFFVHDGGQGREPWALPLAPVDCPLGLTDVEATSPEGARVDFPAFQRAGDVSSSLPVSASIASGSLFPIGTTQVTLTASDPAYPASTCTFPVTVQDTTPPELQCPHPLIVESPNGESVVVEYPPATATDNASTPTVEYSIPSGSTFPVGSTMVEVKVKDAAGLGQSCAFSVQVMPQKTGCGCGSTSPAAALGWLMALVPLMMRRRASPSR